MLYKMFRDSELLDARVKTACSYFDMEKKGCGVLHVKLE